MHSERNFSLAIGSRIEEKYEIEAPIMQDEISELYRVKDVVTKDILSLKILRGDAVSNKTLIKRVSFEGKALARCDHKAVPRVYDFGMFENASYLVMKLIEGTSLEELVQKEGPLGVDQFKDVFRQVANGMQYVHESSIIHTDLKPEFILINRDSTGSTKVTITGFIWSREADDSGGLTYTGELFGSPYYMSPEQCMGMGADKRSDIYTLGATMYYALSGSPPFPGANMVETMSRHVSEQPTQIVDDKGSPLYALQRMVLDRCLEKKPEDRFQSMKEVEQALVGREPVHKPSASLRGTDKSKKGWWPF
jgi:eukaryotic-like serine/threonine-protein kinase